jgi:hypothetical protein
MNYGTTRTQWRPEWGIAPIFLFLFFSSNTEPIDSFRYESRSAIVEKIDGKLIDFPAVGMSELDYCPFLPCFSRRR